MNNKKRNPKGSNIYSKITMESYTTPSGSNNLIINQFYKHSILSGFIKWK
ncbi:MAG: hypothetical protein RJA25_2246 [Bacteroidota bacterium]|jgi:hypothetical protein